MKRKNDARGASDKRVYHTPHLKVHGDLRKLTRTKGGTSNDGGGKPATKASGGNS